MRANHPENELVPYLRGELGADERMQIERHLAQCAQCQRSAESAAAMLAQLAEAIDNVRAPDWVRYRAELRRKLRIVRTAGVDVPGWWRRSWIRMTGFGWPSMAIGATAVAVIAIALVMHRGPASQAMGVEQLELQQEMGSTDVGLLANYRVVEHLDLLENYEVIEHLDQLAPGVRQNHEASS
jgi:anti-sigma factor RsiW